MAFLDELVDGARARVAEARSKVTDDALEQRVASVEPPRSFADVLRGDEVRVIAEVKRATPSAGLLDGSLDVGTLTKAYAAGGAAAISVLTEPDRFQGSLDDLGVAKAAGLPVLRKDFILDPFQILEARAAGADSVLFIVRILDGELGPLVSLSRSLGMEPLVEVFDATEVPRALDSGARVIGINHRDLDSFEVDPDRTAKLAPLLPDDITIVALSGVSTRDEVIRLGDAGADAVLVGTSLVTAPDPVAKLRELLGR